MRDRVREILSWYRSEYPGVLTTLFRLVSHGRLGGTGQLVIIFSGRSKTNETAMLDEVRAICANGGFGSIIGRNSSQREQMARLNLLDKIMRIYRGATQ